MQRTETRRQLAVLKSERMASECASVIQSLEEQRGKYRSDTRQALYEMIEEAAKAVDFMERHPDELGQLLRHKFFKDMRVKPKVAHKAVLQFAFGARSDNQREQANRYGRAIHHLRRNGDSTSDIAHRLAHSGGVRAILQEAKLAALNVPLEAGPDPKQVGVHQLPSGQLMNTVRGEEGEGEPYKMVRADQAVDRGPPRRPKRISPGEGKMILKITCSETQGLSVLSARKAMLAVVVERAVGWKLIEMEGMPVTK